MVVIICMIILSIMPVNTGIILPILPTIFLTYNILHIYKNSCTISPKQYNSFNSVLHIMVLLLAVDLIISHIDIIDLSWLYSNPDDSSDENMGDYSENNDSSGESSSKGSNGDPENSGNNPEPGSPGDHPEPSEDPNSDSENGERCGCHCQHVITDPCSCCYHNDFTEDPDTHKRYYDDPKSDECCGCGDQGASHGCNGCDCSFHRACEAEVYNNTDAVDNHDPETCRGCKLNRSRENEN